MTQKFHVFSPESLKPFQNRLDHKPLVPPVVEIAYNPKTLSGVITNLFRKGLIENEIVGVINRRNGCGATFVVKRTD